MAALPEHHVRNLAELAVRLGANVQPGQVVGVSSEPGKEVARPRRGRGRRTRPGARFVDVSVFDVHVKRMRALYAPRDTLGVRAALVRRAHAGAGRDARRHDRARRARWRRASWPTSIPRRWGETCSRACGSRSQVVNDRTVNWSVIPAPTLGWAQTVYPDLDDDDALARLWDEVAHVCRLDTEDPVAAWNERMDRLVERRRQARRAPPGLPALSGSGDRPRDRPACLAPAGRPPAWRPSTGIVHAANLPTEEVFTTPDPERVNGTVTSTKPLYTSGQLITGLRVRFEDGRAVAIDADEGAETLRALCARDDGRGAAGRGRAGRSREPPRAAWARCSTRRCWTRTRPATSPSARASRSPWTMRRDRERHQQLRAAHRLHDRLQRRGGHRAPARRHRGAAAARRRLADLTRYAATARRGAGAAERARLEIA